MGLNNNGRNKAADGVTAVAVFVSAHTADPGTTGTNEVTGGSPAYARKAITWSAASSGSAASSNSPVLDIPASTTVTHIGFWSAATSGTFYGSADVTDEAFGGQGTYTLSSATVAVT
jgi:hypothetical protein